MTPLIYHKKITPVFYLAFALFTFACFAFSPTAQATPDPASVGGVFNTADGLLEHEGGCVSSSQIIKIPVRAILRNFAFRIP